MKTKRRNPRKRLLCRVGLSLLLTVPVPAPLLGSLHASAHAEENPAVQDPPLREAAALEAGPACDAQPAGIELAPELLALASWPLDESSRSGECQAKTEVVAEVTPEPAVQAGPALADIPLPPPVEIQANSVVRVLAAGMEEEAPAVAPEPKLVAIVAPEELDDIRGGFEMPDLNLKFSFGIERAVFVNGELVASTVLNVVDLQRAAGIVPPVVSAPATPTSTPTPSLPPAGQPTTTPQQPGSGTLPSTTVVQIGNGTGLSIQLDPGLTGAVIQNTLNDQHIKTITTISGSINSAQILRAMNLQSAIQDGVLGSLRR